MLMLLNTDSVLSVLVSTELKLLDFMLEEVTSSLLCTVVSVPIRLGVGSTAGTLDGVRASSVDDKLLPSVASINEELLDVDKVVDFILDTASLALSVSALEVSSLLLKLDNDSVSLLSAEDLEEGITLGTLLITGMEGETEVLSSVTEEDGTDVFISLEAVDSLVVGVDISDELTVWLLSSTVDEDAF